MNLPFRFSIHVLPIPKGRPRFSRVSKRFYTPPRTDAYEKDLRERVSLMVEGQNVPLYDKGVPLGVDIDFVMPRPQRMQRKKDLDRLEWKPTGDDVDNLSKAVLDALQGVLWANDSQVVCLRLRKLFNDKTEPLPYLAVCVYDPGQPPTFTCNSLSREVNSSWETIDESLQPAKVDA